MKRYITLVALCLMLMGCGASKHLSKRTIETAKDSSRVETSKTETSERFTDTTKTETGKVTITEIEFFPPAPNGGDADSLGNMAVTTPSVNLDLHNIGNITNAGAVKSIRQTVIESESVQKGESHESEEKDESGTETSVAVKADESTVDKVIEAPKPNRVKYIFYLALLAVGVLAYIKRVPIVNAIRKMLAGLKLLF